MIPLSRITHVEACAVHHGQACDCDREQLHAAVLALEELPRVIAAATAPHAVRVFTASCATCVGERRLRELGRKFRGETT